LKSLWNEFESRISWLQRRTHAYGYKFNSEPLLHS
jgi:hypothetical protein